MSANQPTDNSKSPLLTLGIPKGSLQETTFALFRKAGFSLSVASRSYYVNCDDDEIRGLLIRAQEIGRYVDEGILDAGITGVDWIRENGAKVHAVPISHRAGQLHALRMRQESCCGFRVC